MAGGSRGHWHPLRCALRIGDRNCEIFVPGEAGWPASGIAIGGIHCAVWPEGGGGSRPNSSLPGKRGHSDRADGHPHRWNGQCPCRDFGCPQHQRIFPDSGFETRRLVSVNRRRGFPAGMDFWHFNFSPALPIPPKLRRRLLGSPSCPNPHRPHTAAPPPGSAIPPRFAESPPRRRGPGGRRR